MKALVLSIIIFTGLSLNFANMQAQSILADKLYAPLRHPSAQGLDTVSSIIIGGEFYWIGFDDAPRSGFVSINSRIPAGALGLGGNVKFEEQGLFTFLDFVVMLSAPFEIGSNDLISIGAQATFNTIQIGIPNVPDRLPEGGTDLSSLLIGLGISYQKYYDNRKSVLSLHLSLPRLSRQLEITPGNNNLNAINYQVESEVSAQIILRHYINESININPWVQVNTQGNKAYIDLGAQLGIKNNLVVTGLGVRFSDFGQINPHFHLGISLSSLQKAKPQLIASYSASSDLGSSYGALGYIPLGGNNPDYISIATNRYAEDPVPDSPVTNDPRRQWQRSDYWNVLLENSGIEVEVINTASFKETELNFVLTDNDIDRYNVSEFNYLQTFFDTVVQKLEQSKGSEGKIRSVEIHAVVNFDLSQTSPSTYTDRNTSISYSKDGKRINTNIMSGKSLSYEEFTALKLENLANRIKDEINFKGGIPLSMEGIQSTSERWRYNIKIQMERQ